MSVLSLRSSIMSTANTSLFHEHYRQFKKYKARLDRAARHKRRGRLAEKDDYEQYSEADLIGLGINLNGSAPRSEERPAKRHCTLINERTRLRRQVTTLQRENRSLKSRITAAEEAKTQAEQQSIDKQLAAMHAQLERLPEPTKRKHKKKRERTLGKFRHMELVARLAARRMAEMKEIMKDM